MIQTIQLRHGDCIEVLSGLWSAIPNFTNFQF